MEFLPNKDVTVALDGTGQRTIALKKDVKVSLNDTLAKFLIESDAGVEFEELDEKQVENLDEKQKLNKTKKK
jgi:hypothetical protein